jgi:hypothetical protein
MLISRRQGRRGPKGRSEEQQQGSAALTEVMQGWEWLTDAERLAWNVEGANRRMKGITYYKQVNLRRRRRGEELTRLPPQPKPYDGRPLLKELHIRNRGGWITLELELCRTPERPRTVWGSLPCNRGRSRPRACPRLGWLPVPRGRRCEITRLYFQKHGACIEERGLPLVGKRIFIRVRQELDDGALLYEQVKAVVPGPEAPRGRKGPGSSKDRRRSFEGTSK